MRCTALSPSRGFDPVSKKGRKRGQELLRQFAAPCYFLVPEVGIEPTLPQGKGDFESELEIKQKLISP
jgi:hypothetical protein